MAHKTRKGRREYKRRWYQSRNKKQKAKLYATIVRSRKLRQDKLHKIVNKSKMQRGGSCAVCGYNENLRALIWHHVDFQTPKCEVAKIINTGNIDKFLSEIKKCILICANCHLILHYSDQRGD